MRRPVSAARRLCFQRRCQRIHPPLRQGRPRHHRRPPSRKIGGVTAKAFGATAKEDMAEEWEPYHWAMAKRAAKHGGEPSSRQVDELLDERLAHRGRARRRLTPA